jgi:hypothetical protein
MCFATTEGHQKTSNTTFFCVEVGIRWQDVRQVLAGDLDVIYSDEAMTRRSQHQRAMWLCRISFETGRSAHYEGPASGSAATFVRGSRRAGELGSGNCQGRKTAHALY